MGLSRRCGWIDSRFFATEAVFARYSGELLKPPEASWSLSIDAEDPEAVCFPIRLISPSAGAPGPSSPPCHFAPGSMPLEMWRFVLFRIQRGWSPGGSAVLPYVLIKSLADFMNSGICAALAWTA
jgi:hypothetical protein